MRLTLEGVSVRYRAAGEEVVVGPLDLDVPGGLVAFSGPSGSGKSTLLRVVALESAPSSGRVAYDGRPMRVGSRAARRWRRRSLAIVHDRANRDLFDDLTCRENVRLWARRPWDECEELLDALELGAAVDRCPGALSGGETRRAALAVAFARQCPVLVADEPTAGLHRRVGDTVVGLLRAAADDGGLVVVSTHDPALVAAADHVVHLDHGRVLTGRDGRP